MDLTIINEAIYDLENSEITAENVKELACLYIIKTEQLKSNTEENKRVVEDELNDILPYYRKYIDIKRKYQLHQLPEEALIDAIEKVCLEVSDLIVTLYSGTDIVKERRQLKKMLTGLYQKYGK